MEDEYLDTYWEDRFEPLDDAAAWEEEQVFQDHEWEDDPIENEWDEFFPRPHDPLDEDF